MYEVKPQDGHYLVIATGPNGIQVRVVTRDKRCSCGRPRCAHVRAVRDYILAGGQRASEVSARTEEVALSPPSLSKCPICGGPIVYGKFPWSATDIWHCEDNSNHYWLWRGEQGARQFMCGEHPTGIPGIDSLEGRYSEWLEKEFGGEDGGGEMTERDERIEIVLEYTGHNGVPLVVASMASHQNRMAVGLTVQEAIGSLVLAYPEQFGVKAPKWVLREG